MFFHLFHPEEALLLPIRLFKYISFRSSFAFLTAFCIALFFGRHLIVYLFRHGNRETSRAVTDVVIQDKKGTPTMGGILIILSIGVSAALWCDMTNDFVLWPLLALAFFGLIGMTDDRMKLEAGSSEAGLSRSRKLLYQGFFGLLFSGMIYWDAVSPFPHGIATNLYIPFFKNPVLDISWLYIPFAIFVIMSISNAVNFADGLDGLAIVPSVTTIAVYGVFAWIIGNTYWANYFIYDTIPGTGEITVLAAAAIGAGMGFLWFNAYPAQVFMGDTGSQALGGMIATIALLVKQEFLFLIAGGIFLAEAVSVLLQDRVGIARIGRRLFYRAPLHHSFQFRGIPESTVVVRFWIISVMLALLSIATIKIR